MNYFQDGERPLFEELHSTLEENLFVIENNVRLTDNCIKKYWEKRADCDLRMKVKNAAFYMSNQNIEIIIGPSFDDVFS